MSAFWYRIIVLPSVSPCARNRKKYRAFIIHYLEYIVIRTNKKESVRQAYAKNAVQKVKITNQSTLNTVGNQERSLLRCSL